MLHLAKYRPACPIIVISRDAQVCRQAHLYRGCSGLEYIVKEKSPTDSPQQDRQKRVEWAMITCKVRGLISPGDLVVVAAGRRNHQGVNESLCHYEIQTVV